MRLDSPLWEASPLGVVGAPGLMFSHTVGNSALLYSALEAKDFARPEVPSSIRLVSSKQQILSSPVVGDIAREVLLEEDEDWASDDDLLAVVVTRKEDPIEPVAVALVSPYEGDKRIAAAHRFWADLGVIPSLSPSEIEGCWHMLRHALANRSFLAIIATVPDSRFREFLVASGAFRYFGDVLPAEVGLVGGGGLAEEMEHS